MELLKSLYAINSKSGSEAEIKAFILECLSDVELTIEEDDFGNLFITKGVAESYPAVTAHIDEVHYPSERMVVVDEDIIYGVDGSGERVGIGADDKNGVWIILKLLHQKPILKIALFVLFHFTQMGCARAFALATNLMAPFVEVKVLDDMIPLGPDTLIQRERMHKEEDLVSMTPLLMMPLDSIDPLAMYEGLTQAAAKVGV